jgi:hypothetical protein
MRRALAFLSLAVFGLFAQDFPPGVLTLARIRTRVQQAVDKLPDCTCVETVDRFWKPAGKQLKPVDRVVLQILFSGGKELFAAPGDTRWESSPWAFLASGIMGNGFFALDLQAVFLNNVSVIAYKGDESIAGRREARYDFSISRMSSGYTVQRGTASAAVATRGSFWADPETYDLRRLQFHAEGIPPALYYAEISNDIRYDRVRIGESDVLLPRDADLRATDLDGEEKNNHIEFTHCQGFHTESTLSFDAGDSAPATRPAAPPSHSQAEGTLAPGLGIAVALSAPLDDHALVGSPIEGRVVGNVVQKGKVLIPDGTLVKGRIRRLEHYFDDGDPAIGDYFTVALEFTQIETPSARLRFYARLQGIDSTRGARMLLDAMRLQRATDRTYEQRVRISTHEVPGVGTFFVPGSRWSLPAGFKTVWTTELFPQSAHP